VTSDEEARHGVSNRFCRSVKRARIRNHAKRWRNPRAPHRLWPRHPTEAEQRTGSLPRKAHLLLVDDDHNTLASLSRAFRLAGHEATVCDNAARAIESAARRSFDLILSDVVMPGKSGLELLGGFEKGCVKTPTRADFRAKRTSRWPVKATKLGALDFLEKPLSTDKLLVTVENALRLSRLEDENRELRQRLGGTNWWALSGDEKVNYANRARGGERGHACAFSARRHGQGTGLRAPSMKNLRGTTIRSS